LAAAEAERQRKAEVERQVAETQRLERERLAVAEAERQRTVEVARLAAAAEEQRLASERLERGRLAAAEAERQRKAEGKPVVAAENQRAHSENSTVLQAHSAVSSSTGKQQIPAPEVVPVFHLGPHSMGRSVQVAAIKLERLIAEPSISTFSEPEPRTPLDQVPVNKNFMFDVDKVVHMQREIRRLDAQIALNPTSADAFYYRANLHYSVASLEKASVDYGRSVELKPSNTAAWINRGAVRRKLGDIAGAIRDYDQAINLSSSDSDAFRNRGIARELSGDLDGAMADWARAAAMGDSDAAGWLAAAKQQSADLGVQILTRMHTQPSNASSSAPFVKPLSVPSLDGPIRQFNIALMSKPRDPQLLFQRGTELLRQGHHALAIEDFNLALKTSPKSVRLIFNRAVALRLAGDLQGAMNDYNTVISLSPKDADAYRNRGIVRQMLGSQSGACADWGVALALGDQAVGSWIKEDCR
jgi:tetratricopeptide (TPR) repeat protein